jgi:predicted permease
MMWFAQLWSRRRLFDDLSDEIREHLEEKIDELVAEGMSREEATYSARREFGNVTLVEQNSREVWRWTWLEDLLMDGRFGARMLRKNPGFTAVAVVTLALGIAANATIFSAVNGWMLRPPRIKDPAHVVVIGTTDPAKVGYGWYMRPVSAPDFVAWRESSRSFESMAARELDSFAVTGEGEPERLLGLRVSADYFHTLGVGAALGRTFLPGDDQAGHEHQVILSHALWERRFASDPKVVGKTMRLNGETSTVVGVMPSHFRLAYESERLWVPLVLVGERLLPAARSVRTLRVLARLKPGISAETASAEVATLAQRAEKTYPGTTQGWGARTMVLQEFIAAEFTVGMRIQMGAVLLLLLIACANIASLQLTRGAARQTEIAVRTALGACRFRLIRQFLVESLLVGLLGGGLGLLLAMWGVSLLRRGLGWAEYAIEMAKEVTIDPAVLVYTLVISVLASTLFGIVPAFQQTIVNLPSTLKEGSRSSSPGRSRRRAHGALVTAQVALAVALLTGSGLMILGFLHTLGGVGIDPKQTLKGDVRLSGRDFKDSCTQSAFFRQVMERLEAMPGAVSVGATTTLVLETSAPVVTFAVEGRAALPRKDRPEADYSAVTPRLFETLRAPLLRGRVFVEHDDAQSMPVAVVNEAFVRRYFPGEDPLGKHIRLDTDNADRTDWSEIVGVVGNIREASGGWEERSQVYEPFFQRPSEAMTIVVRTASDPAAFAPLLRRAIWDINSEQPVTGVETMEEVVAQGWASNITVLTLMGTYAGLALAMATVGVFGVMAYTVARRRHEIGIRMALGARTWDVVRLIAIKGFALGAIGVGIGIVLATPLAFLPTGMAPGMPFDRRVSVVAVASLFLWLVALVASYVPARRATRIDPHVVLRCE